MSTVPKPKAEHKVAKGETIEKIAKKYGFKDIDDIWKYPKNAQLAKLRKKPKDIQPGDVVVIPAYNDDEREEIQDRQRKCLYAANMEKLAAARFADAAAADRKVADAIEKLAAEHKAAGEKFVAEHRAAAKKAKNWSDGVDIANTVIGIVGALRSLALKSVQASEKLAENAIKEFDKIYAEMLKDSKSFVNAPLVSEATKQTGKYLTGDKGPKSDLTLFVGVALESFGKWTSPSFYGQTLSLLATENKSWSQAAAFDLEKDSKAMEAKMKAEIDAIQKTAKQKADAARKRAAESDKAAAAALKKQKELSDEAAKRP